MNAYVEVLKKYGDFSGRASRSEYWGFILISLAISIGLGLVDSYLMTPALGFGFLAALYHLAMIIPTMAVTVRRLHDLGRSGLVAFIVLVPLVGGVLLLFLMLQPSAPGSNQYGEPVHASDTQGTRPVATVRHADNPQLNKYVPIAAAVLTIAYFGYQAWPRSDRAGDFHFQKFGLLPVIDHGRSKPLDTSARTTLMIITHRQQLYVHDPEKVAKIQQDTKGMWVFDGKAYEKYDEAVASTPKRYYPATKWMLDCMTSPMPQDVFMNQLFGQVEGAAFQYKVFRIENDDVIRLLGLERVEGLRYSIVDIAKGYPQLYREARRVLGDEELGISAIDPKKMTLFDAKVVELWQHLNLFMKTCAHGAPLLIPAADGGDQWRPFRDAYIDLHGVANLPPNDEAHSYLMYRNLLLAYQQGERAEFNKLVADHLSYWQQKDPERMRAMRVEVFFNDFAPFYHSLLIYVLVALLGGLSWLVAEWSKPLQRAAFAMMGIAFVVHLSGLIFRMYLQDRAFVFVTNLYSSAVFIGLGCVAVCMLVEWVYKNGIALVVGSSTGFATLIIAHMLSLSGDTLEMMQAVLDTNFWLATHVTCITLGYTAAFVAGGMGIAYILLGMFTNMLRGEGSANLTRMTYGVLCTGMFFSFIGTVLGGLWADYSWGRFWGWDPKENGALLIVLWIALVLHARWGGMAKHRGIAVLSVVGIVVTSWSWFGTNFLGVGLHSYGFRQGAMTTLILIDIGFLTIAGLGMVPLENWTSFRPASANDVPADNGKPRLA